MPSTAEGEEEGAGGGGGGNDFFVLVMIALLCVAAGGVNLEILSRSGKDSLPPPSSRNMDAFVAALFPLQYTLAFLMLAGISSSWKKDAAEV